jgi:hypothetical protein
VPKTAQKLVGKSTGNFISKKKKKRKKNALQIDFCIGQGHD